MSNNKIEGIIYMIKCHDQQISEHYIGSTTLTFTERQNVHQYDCTNEKSKKFNIKLYFYIRQTGGWLNWKMDIIDRVLVDDEKELRQHEQKWIETLKPTLNCKRAFRSESDLLTDRKKINDKHNPFNMLKIVKCYKCGKNHTNANTTNHRRTKYCMNYKTTAME